MADSPTPVSPSPATSPASDTPKRPPTTRTRQTIDTPTPASPATARPFAAVTEAVVVPEVIRAGSLIARAIEAPAGLFALEADTTLLAFIGGQIWSQLGPGWDEMIRSIYATHSDKILNMINGIQASARLNASLDKARAARVVHEQQREKLYKVRSENLIDWRARLAQDLPEKAEIEPSILEEDAANADVRYRASDSLIARYGNELARLSRLTSTERKGVRYAVDYPISLKFAFLDSSLSRPAFRLTKNLIPLPSQTTVYNQYKDRIAAAEASLQDIEKLNEHISLFIELSQLPEKSIVSMAIDAMAMSPDRDYLPSEGSDYAFVIYGQPLDRRHHCFPLHVIASKKGQADDRVQQAIDRVYQGLTDRGLQVKFFCSDGDGGYNEKHKVFFARWIDAFFHNGLDAALAIARSTPMIPVGDFLHLWKNYCSRIKNHPVTLSPDSVNNAVNGEDLESLLKLGAALQDKSSIGKMRDSYALKLFSLKNCLDCLNTEDKEKELMYLLPWALQEEVIRSPTLSRQERLDKATLSFKLLFHYYLLSFYPSAPGVSQRFHSATTTAVTFAETSQWYRILNTALALVLFIMDGDENWCFSRLGTHCLENFFGCIRQTSRGDDVLSTALRIIARTCVVLHEMHALGLTTEHRGRDNLGGTLLGPGTCQLSQQRAHVLCMSFVAISHLNYCFCPPDGLLSRSDLQGLLAGWVANDCHHKGDPVYRADFSRRTANHGIDARNRRTK
jgi:hypothetical protein